MKKEEMATLVSLLEIFPDLRLALLEAQEQRGSVTGIADIQIVCPDCNAHFMRTTRKGKWYYRHDADYCPKAGKTFEAPTFELKEATDDPNTS